MSTRIQDARTVRERKELAPHLTPQSCMDSDTTLRELKRQVAVFRDARDWRRYDAPKNLAVSVSVEAAELLEHFQWKTDGEVSQIAKEAEWLRGVADELADLII